MSSRRARFVLAADSGDSWSWAVICICSTTNRFQKSSVGLAPAAQSPKLSYLLGASKTAAANWE